MKFIEALYHRYVKLWSVVLQCSLERRWTVVPPKVVALCGGGWALQHSACRDRNDEQPPGSSYVSDTVLFSHEWHTCY